MEELNAKVTAFRLKNFDMFRQLTASVEIYLTERHVDAQDTGSTVGETYERCSKKVIQSTGRPSDTVELSYTSCRSSWQWIELRYPRVVLLLM